MQPRRAGGTFAATWMASLRSRASIRRNPPSCSILQSDVFAVFEQMGRHHPREPHWFLPLIGVDPMYQGQGRGSALLRHALLQCDRDRVPAYLE